MNLKQSWEDWQKDRKKKKQKKARERRKNEQTFKKKHPYVVRFWKKNMTPLLSMIVLFSVTMVGLLLYSMWTQYQDTVYWEDHHDENIAMAQQPPSLLYDPDIQSQDAKMNFLSIYHEIYDEETRDFTENVEQEAIEQLSIELGYMTEDDYKAEYESMFDNIGNKWDIERQYQDLYVEEGMIAEHVTPQTIVALNEQVYPVLDDYSRDTWNQDQFAIRIYEWQHTLLEDAQILNNQALQLSQWLSNEDGKWRVQPDLYPAQYDAYVEELEAVETTFDWQSRNYLNDIAKAIQPITVAHAERHDLYTRIQADQAERETALANVEATLDTANANLNEELNAIDSERTALIAEADALRNEQETIENSITSAENAAEDRAEVIQREQENAEQAEEQRIAEEAQREEDDPPEDIQENQEQGQEIPEDTEPVEPEPNEEEVEEEERTQEEALVEHHGEPALDVLPTLEGEFTYERQGVDPSLENGVIESHYINADGNPHFIIVLEENVEENASDVE